MNGTSEVKNSRRDPVLAALFQPAGARRSGGEQEMLVAEILPPDPRSGLALFELTVQPGFERIYPPRRTGVMKHVFLLKGEMELYLDGAWSTVAEGQSVQFNADRAHGYRNRSGRPALLHDLVHDPHTAAASNGEG